MSNLFNIASETTDQLVTSLQNPALYNHPIKSYSVLETHISWVLLTGDFAYKIKKPVDLGFVDFSTLAKRKFYCGEELRLNKRFAPDLYLQVVPIYGSRRRPNFDGAGPIIEYALRMKQFPQSALLSHMAAENKLEDQHIDALAQIVASFHQRAPVVRAENPDSAIETILNWSRDNFDQIEANLTQTKIPEYFHRLKDYCNCPGSAHLQLFRDRMQTGFVRECHGDLHLGNIALVDQKITLFDCIEFDPELRNIDTVNEIAFVMMDLFERNLAQLAWRFVNRYMSVTGDYGGLRLLRYYFVYRALVRAKVASIRFRQSRGTADSEQLAAQVCLNYLELAQAWSTNHRPALIIMHGLSGSGKSTIASQLSARLGAIQIRSDIERKRLHQLEAGENSESSLNSGIYDPVATRQTYDRLALVSELVTQAGLPVIVDASFLKAAQRSRFSELAHYWHVPHVVVSCVATEAVLRQRIIRRSIEKQDASEADIDVLNHQINSQDRISTKASSDSIVVINTEQGLGVEQLEDINRRLEPEAITA